MKVCTYSHFFGLETLYKKTYPPSDILIHCHLFLDINECSTYNKCGYNARCTDTIGSYTCTCNNGYKMRGSSCVGK